MLSEDDPERRAYALEGRLQAMGEVLAAAQASFDQIDVEASAEEIAIAYARAYSDFGDWLIVANHESAAELRQIADQLGMGDLPHEEP